MKLSRGERKRSFGIKLRLPVLLGIFGATSIFFMFSGHPAFAFNTYDIHDQASCQAVPGATWTGPNQCSLPSQLTLNSGDSLTIESGIFVPIGSIDNFGSITNHGNIVNSGNTVTNEVGGVISNDGEINDFGTINNHGTILNSGTIDLDNNGAISCFGDLTAIINNYAGGIISNNSGGTINISGNANGQAAFNNSGTVNNNIGAIINNNNSAVFTNNSGGSVNNSGTINNNSPNPTHATIPPCSTIHTMNTNGGTIVNNANGTVTNSGTINDYCGSTFTNNGSLTGNPVVNKCVPTVTITSVSNTNPKWGVPVSVSGTATNFVSTDTISVDWGDGSSPTVISASASWGPVTHPYSAAAIATNPNNIVATLLSGTTVDATSASFPITVQKHDVTLTANAPDVKWSKDHALTGKLTDNDAGGAAIGSATIVPGGDDTFGAGPFTTAADGSYSATGTAPPGPAGPHSDTAKYLGDGSYNPAGPITANYNTLKHDVTLTLAPIANLKWSFAYTGTSSVKGTLTDNDAGAAGIPAAIIAISGSGLGTLSASVTTIAGGSYSDAGNAPPGPAAAKTLNADYAGDGSYNVATTATQNYNTLKHDTALTAPALTDVPVKWDHTYHATAKVTDVDVAGAAISGVMIDFSGSGVTGTATSAATDVSGTTPSTAVQASGAGSVGLLAIHAKFNGDSNYNTVTSSDSSVTITKHQPTLTINTIQKEDPIAGNPNPSVRWDHNFDVSVTLADPDSTGLKTGNLNSKTVSYTGAALSTAQPFNVNTAGGTADSSSATKTLTAAGAGNVGLKAFTAAFDGTPDPDYLTASIGGSTTITKHATTINLNSIVSPFAGNLFSVNGELDDVDASNKGIPNEPLTFVINPPGSGGSVPGATTNGVTFSDSGLIVNSCSSACIANVMRLHADPTTGALITLPSNPPYVTLFLADMDGSVTIQVTYGDGSTSDPADPQFTHAPVGLGSVTAWGLTSPDNVGISKIQIYGVSGGTTGLAGISEVQTFDSILGQVLDITFNTISTPTPTVSFNQGEFFTVGTSPSTVSTGLSVKGAFAGDLNYLGIDPTSSKFNTYFSTTSGVGGIETASGPESGTAITAATCPSGDTLDVDNLCKTWKSTGIPYTYKNLSNVVSTAYYTLPAGSNVGDDDIYYEIDSMTGFNPNPSSLVDVQNMFQTHKSNGHNIKFFYTNDQQNLSPVTTLGMWSGSGTVNLGTDYDSIKAYNFGIASERPVIGGSQAQSIIAGAGTLTQTVEANGVTITTPANSATGGVTEGTLIVKVKLSLPSGGTITVGTPTQPSGFAADSSLRAGAITASITSKSTTLKLLTIKMPFDTTGAVSGVSFGKIDVPLTLGTAQTVSPTQNILSPIYTTTLLTAKSQAYRYALFVNGIGGPSGMSFAPGNKLVVALGASVYGSTTPTENQQAGTLAHEVGHNLGLLHGGPISAPSGDTSVNCKPNYESIMSYSRQLPTYLGSHWKLDYSEGVLLPLTELSGLLDKAGTPVSQDTSLTPYLPFIVWGTPGGTIVNTATTNSKLYNFQQTVKLGTAPPDIDWIGTGVVSGSTLSAPLSGFGINGCSETAAGAQMTGLGLTGAYNDYNDWNNLNFNFQTSAGVSFTGAGGTSTGRAASAAALYTAFDPKAETPPHSDFNNPILETQSEQSAEYPGLIPPPSLDGSTSLKGGANLPLKFQYFVSGTKLVKIQTTPTTPSNFIGYVAPIISTTACTNAGCGPATTGPNLIASQGSWSLNTIDPSNEYYQFNWKTPTVTKNTKYFINIFINSPALPPGVLPQPLSAAFASKPLMDPTKQVVTMIITLNP